MILDDQEHQQVIDIPEKELLDYTIERLIEGLKIHNTI